MASPIFPASLLLLLLLAAWPLLANAQGQGICPNGAQPVAATLDPPSGTTGVDPRASSNYTITGALLDAVGSIEVLGAAAIIGLRNSTIIMFHIPDQRLRPGDRLNATVSLIPSNRNCLVRNLSVLLFPTLDIIFFEGGNSAQPGTVFLVSSRTCVPGECGDNSTNFDLVFGDITLERLSTQNTTLKYAGRFPNFEGTLTAQLTVVTQYQAFRLSSFIAFNLIQPSPITVTPSIGQRGTDVLIQGADLLGIGHSSQAVSRVRLGDNDAVIANSSSRTQLRVRARSGTRMNGTVRINTTDTFEGVVYDGPYLYLENGWTQLNDGQITSIIPRAAQSGRNVLLCGDDLLGNGVNISTIQHGSNFLLRNQPSPLPSVPPQPGSECLEVRVPDNVPNNGESPVDIISNTGAMVTSISNFTVAAIESVTPNRGQPGTIVTIRGRALLSGYPNSTPIVFLSDLLTLATLIRASSSEIVVRAQTPPLLNPGASTGSGTPLPEIIGVPGSVVIQVTSPLMGTSLRFNVSNTSGWQYEESGVIDMVVPGFGQFGTLVNISGRNLLAYGSNLTHAMVDGMNATLLDGASDSAVQLLIPDSSSTSLVDIVLFSDTGAEVRGSVVFEYRERGNVSAVVPSRGQNGTFVTIEGTNLFGHGDNITSVVFGDIPAVIDHSASNNSRILVRVQASNNTVDTAVPIRITADTSAIVASSGAIWTFLVQGAITSNQPLEGQVGTIITINGANLLGGGNSISEIFLDGVSGTVTSNSSSSITIVMDDLMTQRPDFFPGLIYILSDTGAIVTGGNYAHRASGNITNFSPNRGRRGTTITIQGSNVLGFGTNISGIDVAGVSGTVMSFNSTTVIAAAGMGPRNQTGPIVLRINTGATITSAVNFTYDQPGVVTSVSPMMGAEGTGVSVSGAGLTPDNILLTSITVGGVPVSRVVTASNQEVSIIVGPAPLNNSDRAMILINANDGSFVDGGFFSFITFTISLNGISRGQGGTVIEINLPNATQFEPNLNLRATVDDILATTASVNGTGRRLRVSVPRARRQGTYVVDVAVEGANGVVARLRDGFTYLAEGLICTVDPAVGQPGTLITLQGDNLLGGGNSIESASVAGKPAMVRQMNNTVALLELMESSSERPTQSYPLLGDIILTADTGAVVQRLDAFSLTEPGNIAQVSPLMGQNGTMVNISGTNLLQGGLEVRSITLAGVPAVVVSNSTDTLISVQAASSAATQPLSVVITLSTGATISSRSNITFQYVARGTVSTVSPNSGAVGTRVLITGRDLLQGGGAVRTVLLGGVQAMLRGMPSNMAINVTASAGTPGLGDVVIVSDTGSTLTERNRWTTEALGTISSVSPAIGQQGFEVTVSGRSLLGAAASQFSTCLLAGVPATIVQGEFNSTAARCRAGSSPFSRMNHSGPVELVTETGVAIRSAQNVTFTYYSAYIDSVTPGSGNNGTEVTIRGLNLYNSPGGSFQLSRVLLGSIEANVTSSTNSEVSVRVDISNVSTSNEDVRIESSSGSFLVLASAWNYTIPRVILSLKPQSGLPGETVTLYGQNLVPDGATAARVIVGQTEAFNVQLINSSTIQFQVGIYQNSDLPETNLPIQLVYPSGETTFNSSVLFQYNSTYENVTSISPVAGGENARVVISGTNLTNPAAMIRRITLAGIPVTVQSASDNEIIVEAGPPPPSGTSGQLLIETTGGRLYGLAGEVWEYYPVITSGDVSPITGQNGTNVTIDLSRVSNLPAIMGVNLNGVPATDVSVNSSGTLTLRAGQSPNTPIGSIIISLATGTIVIPSAWSYQAPVTITNISPSSGYFNTLVTITGSGFQAGLAMVNDVYLARTRTAIEFQNDTMLQVRLLQETMSDSDVIGPVIILTNTGSFYSSEQQLNFTYVGVQVSSISPMSGTRGTLVTLTGVGLLAGGMNITSATLAGVPATVRSSMSSSVSFAAGALASSSNLSSIEYMMNTGARVRIMRSWRYVEPGVITSVTPTEGAMGTIVSISGSNLLGGGTRAMAVALNTRATSTILESFDNFVQVVAASSTGPLQPGSIQVISDTQAITESTSEVQFSYLEPGTISSVNPSQGQNGTVVSITGQRFHNGEGVTRVYIAGVEAAIRSIENNSMTSTITVEAGRPMDSGSFEGPVLVLSSRNTTTVSSLNFTYLSEGIIFSVVPRQGRNGTIVAIEGENLLGGGTDLQNVTLAGEAAEIINQTAGTFSTVFVRAPLGPSSSFTGDVVLVSNMNAHVRRVDGWTRTQQGVVNSVVPNQGQYGTNVTITGQNLLSGSSEVATLRFGDVPLMVESATDTTIVATVGEPDDPRAFMSESISISSDSGGSLYVDYRWEFLNQSSILSLSPPNGSSQEVIVINGTNLLGGGTTIESVIIAGIPGRVMAGSSDKQVMVMAGANELGSLLVGDLVLKSDTGALTVATWMYDEECPINMFGTAMDCEPCSEQCARCNGPTEFNCTECLNFALYIGENSTILFCVEKCPNVSTLDNVCVDACETNQYQRIDSVQNQTFCYNCSDLCDPSLGCSGPEPSQCGGCMFFRDVNQTCIENCSMDLFFEDGMRNCVPCHPQCVGGCSGPSEFECDSCATLRVDVPGVNLGDSVCRETCPNLFFLDTVSNPDVCQPCDRSCSIGCSGPTPFDCMRCRNVSIEGPNRRKMCLDACGPNYYVNESNFCLPCSNLCLAGAGCTGLGSSDCNRCSLTHAPDDRCVLECQDSTYFIRNSTRRCERCADACGTRGCTEAGPENCNSQSPFSAGPGTTALVIIIILILIAVIAVLAVIVFLMYRRRGSSAKYKFPNVFSTRKKNNEEATRYTRSAQVQSIPLASIEQEKEMQSNPLFVEEGPAGLYSEMGVDHEMDELYSDAEGHEHGMFLEKNNAVSASQDLYTDMDNLPPSKPVLEEVSASQDVYTDMEPILSKQEPTPLPALPPKPVDKKEDTDPLLPPNEPGRDEARPPIPEKAQKPPPPPPEPSGELYTDMQGGITEVFINPTADDLYVDVETPETPAAKYVPPEEEPLESDTTYEDTESVLASMDQYRNKSFGAGTRNASASVLQNSNAKSISKRQSAPALPSQPIPTRKPSTSAGTPLPPTPMHKSLSATSFPSSTSPTSTLTRPGSVISSGSAIPEEECLYDDIGGVQPLVAAPAPAPPKAQPRKKDPKLKTKKK